jgi:hypothetical protein
MPGIKSIYDHAMVFYDQGDFGRLRGHREQMVDICTSKSKVTTLSIHSNIVISQDGTYIACSDHLKYCTARNFYFDFKTANLAHSSSKR